LSYANVLATLALAFTMGGVALAFEGYLGRQHAARRPASGHQHYLLNSIQQIKPSLLTRLDAPGSTGPRGPAGTTGSSGPAGTAGHGEEGPLGAPGRVGPSSTGPSLAPVGGSFAVALPINRLVTLFTLPGGVSARLDCIGFQVGPHPLFEFGLIDVAAPEPAHAHTRMIERTFNGEPLEETHSLVANATPNPEYVTVAALHPNHPPGGNAGVPVVADVNSTISAPGVVVIMNANWQVTPEGCQLEGAVAAVPAS
jgi:hypothetical protein